ncbi:hypothetical protein KS4_01690 [Poriferisphaera corsica]|uniref:Prepilin-type N-terminal cleavage/methylation domain-containing protein n=1 Tax=Poriferisphaera corsica TaxID=2528020 RepID=A0A517YPI8_9BACT|nr:prepilin-type N-terminal cleavage/methylation domain-containing protein [Poriferisphaera corsica]QDU32140.1 hypothetical protein KS4_01690 [Poriferisphaera corsica]
MSRESRNGVWDGFTLIELLVVISIIALLIGILLPALGAARKTAMAVKCNSMLRQFNTGNYMYATDSDGWKVPTHAPWDTSNQLRWIINKSFSSYVASAADYKSTGSEGWTAEYFCPEATSAIEGDNYWDEPSIYFSYTMNASDWHWYNALGKMDEYPHSSGSWKGAFRMSSVKVPTEVIFMADGFSDAFVSPAEDRYVSETYHSWSSSKGAQLADQAKGSGTIGYRHPGNSANLAFLDGHNESMSVEVLAEDYKKYFYDIDQRKTAPDSIGRNVPHPRP